MACMFLEILAFIFYLQEQRPVKITNSDTIQVHELLSVLSQVKYLECVHHLAMKRLLD